MNAPAEIAWTEPFVGQTYKQRTMVIAAEAEQKLLACCDIPLDTFGGNIDPAAFISLAIQEGVLNGIHANGTVNMVQSIIQHRPLRLGETITVTGKILKVDVVPRGKVVTSETWFAGENGERGITARRLSLRPDPAKPDQRGAGEKAPPVIADPTTLRELGSYTLTPENTKNYGSDTVNPIHVDPEAARRGGFRAPIIGGGQGVRYLTAAIWREFSPRSIDLDIWFRRPLFWDDSFTVRVDDQNGAWKAICLAKGDKVATEARINQIAR